jgi:hypothetical protein
MKKKREGILMVQDHQGQEQKKRNQQTSEEERLVPRGRLALLENMWLNHCANHSFCSGTTIVCF